MVVAKMKKAQMKIQQMSFMLLAVTLLFVLVGMFFLTIRFSGLKKEAQELENKNAMLLVSKLANSAEFSCEETLSESNCIDADKAMALKGNIERYRKFWGVEKIEIRKIYPDNGDVKCTLENYDKCGIIEVFSGGSGNTLPFISNFVSLCRKESENSVVYDKCELAKLMVAPKNKEE